MSVVAVYEGDTDLPVVRKLLDEVGLELAAPIDAAGKARIDAELDGYNEAAKGSPWLVLRDLDDDADCAPTFLSAKGWRPNAWMCFRIAVRELESWILADVTGVTDFFGVASKYVPPSPDDIADPTRALVDAARRSKHSRIKKGMVPRPGSGVSVGPLYEGLLMEFGTRHWSPSRASARSPSLTRARAALQRLADRWNEHCRGDADA